MGVTDQTKWSCDRCERTVVIYGTADDIACALHAIQRCHTKNHDDAEKTLAKLGLMGKRRKDR